MNVHDAIKTVVEHPLVTAAGGAAMTTIGTLDKVAETSPTMHDWLSNASIFFGIIAVIIGIAVQVRNYQIQTIKKNMLERKSEERRLGDNDRRHHDHS